MTLVQCTHCGTSVDVPPSLLGKSVRCPICSWKFIGSAPERPSSGAVKRPEPAVPTTPAGVDEHRRASGANRPAQAKSPMAAWRPVLISLVIAGLLIVGRYAWQIIARHTQTVAAQEFAEEWLKRDTATGAATVIDRLRVALEQSGDVENKDLIALLHRVREQQRRLEANALLARAQSAIDHQDLSLAIESLQSYLNHSHATERGLASNLLQQADRAISADAARTALRQFSDEDLKKFNTTGEIPAGLEPADPRIATVFSRSLRENLQEELKRRRGSTAGSVP